MKKAPEAFRTITEVSDLLGTPPHVLRFWESKFYQIRPVKRAGNRRYYRPDDVALINGIRILLMDRGYTIRGVQRVLMEKGVRHVVELGSDLPEGALGPAEGHAGEDDHAQPAAAASTEAGAAPAAPAPPDRREGPAGAGAGASSGPRADRAPAAPRLPLSPAAPAPAPAVAPPPAPAAPPRPRIPAPPPPPAAEPALPAEPVAPRLAQLLRQLPRDALVGKRERSAALVRRIDALLDRMSEASGSGRW